MTLDASSGWPDQPYLGLRHFEATDRLLYSGRDVDVNLCLDRLSSPAVRVLVLQGVSGSGKSSFLRAGLLPHLKDLQDQDPTEGVVPITCPVHAGEDVISRIAHEVYDFITSDRGRNRWTRQALALKEKYPSSDSFGVDASEDESVLINLLAELSLSPRYSFLIAVDQVEELWSTSGTKKITTAREQFLRLVNEFALERLNGKLVLTLRTEWYGIFASKLPDSTMPSYSQGGVNRLCHHFLADPSRDEMVSLVKRPAISETANYKFCFEEKAPEKIVDALRQLTESEGTDISVLPLLQITLKRLYDEGKARCKNGLLTITFKSYQSLIAPLDHLNSIDLLDGYMKFGLQKALGSLLGNNASEGHSSLVHLQTEVNHWCSVVETLTQRGTGDMRCSQRKSIADLESSARDAECILASATSSVLPLLASTEIGLLAKLDGSDEYTLRHDLLSRVFNRRQKISSVELWRQTFTDQQKRISLARSYSLEELYGEDSPYIQKIQLAELRFWDHKALAYASAQGFFKRLGFDVQMVVCNENVSATDLMKTLATKPQTLAVYSFPRRLMSPPERKSCTDVVVLNQFTGYAVICNASALLPRLEEEISWEKFDSTIVAMIKSYEYDHRVRFVAEDKGAANFFKQALKLFRGKIRRHSSAAISKLSKAVEIAPLAGTAVLDDVFQTDVPFVAIVTAPTWAISRMMGENIKTVFDHRNLLMLLDQPNHLDTEIARRMRHSLVVHNVLNINIPHDSIKSEHDPLLMKLASVGLFLANCIWALDDDVGKWIRNQWINTQPSYSPHVDKGVTEEVFLDTFRRSYLYAQSGEYFNNYFDFRTDPVLHQRGISDHSIPDDCQMAMQIYNKLLQAQVNYQQYAVALASALKHPDKKIEQSVNDLIERARKHADICNYYDAERILKKALSLIDGVSSSHG